jgi:hypothetical protein
MPALAEMSTFPQFVALASRNDVAPYAQAFLAVDALIERHGLPAVIRYFELFAASQDRTGNFTAAFGEDRPRSSDPRAPAAAAFDRNFSSAPYTSHSAAASRSDVSGSRVGTNSCAK